MDSLVVIGMRGAGKSTVGRLAAAALGFAFVDTDERLEADEGQSCAAIIEAHGWEGFREREHAVLRKVLAENPVDAVVACGGGIVETEAARSTLNAHKGPVLHVRRGIEDVKAYLAAKELASATGADLSEAEAASRRPGYGEEVQSVWERRLPFFEECSTHCFRVVDGDADWERISREAEAMVLGLYVLPTPSAFAPGSVLARAEIGQSAAGADAAFCTLPAGPQELSRHRRAAGPSLVLDCGDDEEAAVVAVRHGVPFVCLDSASLVSAVRARCSRWAGTTRFAVRWAGPVDGDGEGLKGLDGAAVSAVLFDAASSLQAGDAVLALGWLGATAGSPVPVFALTEAADAPRDHAGALCASRFGAVLVDSVAGPALGRVKEMCSTIGTAPLEQYYLFGHPIQASPSPAMHNAGFVALGLPRRYGLCDTTDIARVRAVMHTERFRGASVTIPHKEAVMEALDSISPAAAAIGAVNTVIRGEDGKLAGDNTDWLGIRGVVAPQLEARAERHGTALVVGAGGTALSACYCVKQLGLKLLVYNRTVEKAQRVAERFEGAALEDLAELPPLDLIVCTVPATAGFELPDTRVLEACKPVVLDAAYKPRRTKALIQASASGCATFEGIDMLVEQGLHQMRLWTGREASAEMDAAARDFYDRTVK